MFRSWKPTIDELTNEEAGELLKKIFAWHDEEELEVSRIANLAFVGLEPFFKNNKKKYKKICEDRRDAGRKGGKVSQRRGFLKEEDENSFYILSCSNENEKFIKVGITMLNISRRYSGQKCLPYDWEVIYENICDTTDGIRVENEMHDSFDRFTPSIKFGGYSECYSYKDAEAIVSKAKQSLSSEPKKEKKKEKENNNKNKKEKNIIISSNEDTAKADYGNKGVNDILKGLKAVTGREDFKESQKYQRFYGKHFVGLLKKIGKDEFRRRLDIVLDDDFKEKNCNSLKYLYGEIKSASLFNPKKKGFVVPKNF